MKATALIPVLLLSMTIGAGPAPEPADVPAFKKLKDGTPDPRFMARHESYVAIAKKGGIDLLLTGDFLVDDAGQMSLHGA